jgi:hypothetical protein
MKLQYISKKSVTRISFACTAQTTLSVYRLYRIKRKRKKKKLQAQLLSVTSKCDEAHALPQTKRKALPKP